MTPFECFKTYSALKLHFTSDYNYFQYNGNLRLKPESFEKRNDKVFFAKVAKHTDPLNFLMVNILENPKAWIRNIAYSPDAENKYSDWLKRRQSMAYTFKEDLKKLNPDFDSNLRVAKHEFPELITKYMGGHVSLDTVCIIVAITGCMKYWDKSMAHFPMWDDISLKIKKYLPFMSIDADKYKKIILDSFERRD
jgi:hypothetical protein